MRKEEPDLKFVEKLKLFLAAHWRGICLVLVPLIFLSVLVPFSTTKPWQWCAFTLFIMAIFWVSECIPLAVTGFIPCMIFPLTGVMTSSQVCSQYVNDSVMMFLGSLLLAYSVEQSGLHKRMAYFAIRSIGYSHLKLLLAMCCVTTFVSMWITNTAATTMMVPIIFAILRVFEGEGILKIYDKNREGEKIASDITTSYFCAITYSATVGGIGTLVGTATNLVFKSLFHNKYADAPEYLSFPKFSLFALPLMITLEASTYCYLAILYYGWLRPNADVAKSTKITKKAQSAAKYTIEIESKKLGRVTYWEAMVLILFGGAMIAFFCRSPQIFKGWGDMIISFFNLTNKKFVKDSAMAMLVVFLMLLLPSSLRICDNFKVKHYEEMPKSPVPSVLGWRKLNAEMPYSFMFLLGGGVALSKGADWSGLNNKLGDTLAGLASLHNFLIIFLVALVTCFVTNFASNVAVCNVFGPIAMTLAEKVNVNPLWYIITAGYTASFCFMLPVGTPGNLVVQIAANIPTTKMMKAGFGPTIFCLLLTWFFVCFYAPLIWPDITSYPTWAPKAG